LKNIFKVLRNYCEFVLFITLKNILGLFSFNFASNIGGILVGFFGKFTKYEQIIKNNLKVLNLSDEKSSMLRKENLKETGKVFFEFFNLNKFNWKNIDFNTLKSTLYWNDETPQEAIIKDANPFDTLAWVINLRLSLNLNIPKGSKIITGSVIKTRSPKKGDVVTYNVGNLSETKIRLI